MVNMFFKYKKLIFLDFDGVLRTQRSIQFHHTTPCRIDMDCINNFNRIIAATNAKIVLSTAWRTNIVNGKKILRDWFIVGDCIGVTPYLCGELTRSDEIEYWLNLRNVASTVKIVILDDEDHNWSERLKPLVLTCNFYSGLTEDIAEKAIQRLNNEN